MREAPTAAELKLLTRLLIHGRSYCRTTGPIARRLAQRGWVEDCGFDEYKISQPGERKIRLHLPAVGDLIDQHDAQRRRLVEIEERIELFNVDWILRDHAGAQMMQEFRDATTTTTPRCPHCHAAADVAHRVAGDRVRCPACGGWYLVTFSESGAQLVACEAPPGV